MYEEIARNFNQLFLSPFITKTQEPFDLYYTVAFGSTSIATGATATIATIPFPLEKVPKVSTKAYVSLTYTCYDFGAAGAIWTSLQINGVNSDSKIFYFNTSNVHTTISCLFEVTIPTDATNILVNVYNASAGSFRTDANDSLTMVLRSSI
jgi:hypothetical protein